MSESHSSPYAGAAVQRPWDARLARRLITPLKNSRVTPNTLTTVRLGVGLAAAAAFLPGTYGWSNLAALLLVLSNFLDHTDGELARITGKSSRIGHLYDLASDAVVTVLLFVAMGAGLAAGRGLLLGLPPVVPGAAAGVAIALIFWLRMQIEALAGKAANRQASMGGFETEDVLYLLPLVTLCNGVLPFLVAASIGAPLFALWVIYDYRRQVFRRRRRGSEPRPAGAPEPL
jgi:phosphatidylglycerophosphate synthase